MSDISSDSEVMSDSQSEPRSEDQSDDGSEVEPKLMLVEKRTKSASKSKPKANAEDEDGWDPRVAIRESLDLLYEGSETSFAAQGSIGEANPGLVIEDVGSIGVPISEHDAKRLISASRQAPFGKGRETFVDTTVRQTWEIDAARISFQHPKWPSHLQEAIDLATQQLGIAKSSQQIRAELYKLLIYEEGAMFKAHTDTEKADGMFGTLAVCLPCKHTGGDVELSFQGQQRTLTTGPTSAWTTTFLAWYSDVLHEVKPVSSGYRVVLTFNLVQAKPTSSYRLAASNDQAAGLWSALSRWHEYGDPPYLVWPLEHEYTDMSLELDRLKGNDTIQVQGVITWAEGVKAICYLASVEKEITGSVEDNPYGYSNTHDIIDEIDSSLKLTRVVTMDGIQKFTDLPIEEDDFLDAFEDVFDDEPDDEEFGGYTGNEGAETTHWYRKTALVIVPRDHYMDLSIKCFMPRQQSEWHYRGNSDYYPTKELRKFIQETHAAHVAEPSRAELEQDLDRLCSVVIARNRCRKIGTRAGSMWDREDLLPFQDDIVADILNIHFARGQLEKAANALSAFQQIVPWSVITEIMKQFSRFSFPQLQQCMDTIAQSYPDPTSRLNVCDNLLTAFENHSKPDKTAAATWRLSQDDFLLSNTRDVKREDAAVLIAAVIKHNTTEWFLKRVVPFLVEQKGNSAFLIAFATSLFMEAERGRFDRQTFRTAFEGLWESVIADLHLPRDAERNMPHVTLSSFVQYKPLPQPKNRSLKPDDLLGLHQTLLDLERRADIDNLMAHLQQQATVVHMDYMLSLVIPYLRGAVQLLRSKDIDGSTGSFREMFVTMLTQYVQKFVQMEPLHPTDWTKTEKGCKSCADCTKLDAFLRSPTQKVEEF